MKRLISVIVAIVVIMSAFCLFAVADETGIKYITVTQLPERVKYYISKDMYEIVGGTATVTYTDGSTEDIPLSECTVKSCIEIRWDSLGSGWNREYQLEMKYEGYTFIFTMQVVNSIGDVNWDRAIDLSDVTKVLQYIANWNVSLNVLNADVTEDGKVNLSDVASLMKHIAG